MKYKGFDSELIRQVLANIKEVPVSGAGYQIHQGSLNSAIDYFNSIKMPEIGTLLRLAYDKYFGENFSSKLIYLDSNNKITGAEVETIPELKGLALFGEQANILPNVALSVPVLGEIVSALTVVFSVIGIFSNEPRTRSFDMKNKLYQKFESRKNYLNLPAGSMERNITRTTGIAVRELVDLRPKCVANTTACALEHLRYDLRGSLMIEASDSFLELALEYFNDSNFKEFVDNYQMIKASILPAKVPPVGTTTTPPVKQEESKSSLLPIAAGVAGLILASKLGGS